MMDTAPARRIAVFFYGLFMDADLLRERGCHPSDVRRAYVDGFGLRIGRRATLWPTEGDRAYGVVMSLTHGEIRRLYQDDTVRDYYAEAVVARLMDGEGTCAALCFNLAAPPAVSDASAEYAAKLRDLALRLGLPKEYVARIVQGNDGTA